jgi:hypothetical protein
VKLIYEIYFARRIFIRRSDNDKPVSLKSLKKAWFIATKVSERDFICKKTDFTDDSDIIKQARKIK